MPTHDRAILINSWVISIAAVPVVWMIGYQDHRWRSPYLAVLAAVLFVAASVALLIAAEHLPESVRRWPLVARAVAFVSLVLALFWGVFG